LLNDFASEMVYPLLPAFVTTLGGGAVALGALDGAADLAAAALRVGTGRLADRPRWRGPLIVVGYALPAVLRPVIGWASHAWQVIGVRVLDRIGKGLRSPARDALIADLTPEPIQGRAFGLQRAADHLGAVLGAVLAAELLRRGVPIHDVLKASLIPGIIALGVLAVALRVSRRRVASAPPRPGGPPLDRPLIGPLALLAMLAATRLPETLLLLRLQDLGLAVPMIPLVWAALHVVRSAVSYPAGILADRIGVKPVVALGVVAYAVTVLLLALRVVPGVAVAAFLGHGLASGFLEPAERAAVARTSGAARGKAFGTYQAMAGAGGLATAIGYGLLYQTRGGAAALAVAAALGGVVLVVWLMVSPTHRGTPKPLSA
jgi:MFS family permease